MQARGHRPREATHRRVLHLRLVRPACAPLQLVGRGLRFSSHVLRGSALVGGQRCCSIVKLQTAVHMLQQAKTNSLKGSWEATVPLSCILTKVKNHFGKSQVGTCLGGYAFR